jgi:hypothetical protein
MPGAYLAALGASVLAYMVTAFFDVGDRPAASLA